MARDVQLVASFLISCGCFCMLFSSIMLYFSAQMYISNRYVVVVYNSSYAGRHPDVPAAAAGASGDYLQEAKRESWKATTLPRHIATTVPDELLQALASNSSADADKVGVSPDLEYIYGDMFSQDSVMVPRKLDRAGHKDLLSLVATVKSAFTQLNYTWVMNCGTLLGSYVSHDVLPWDDDIDLLVKDTDIQHLKTLHKDGSLKKKYGLGYAKYASMQKLFFCERKPLRNLAWSWPFVDLRKFEIVNGMVLNDDRRKEQRLHFPVSWFFPVHMRPFGSLWLPSPRRPWHYLSLFFRWRGDHMTCSRSGWNHRKERHNRKAEAPCHVLKYVYAFVWRQPLHDGTLETLRQGDNALHSVYVPETYVDSNPFEWRFLEPPALSVLQVEPGHSNTVEVPRNKLSVLKAVPRARKHLLQAILKTKKSVLQAVTRTKKSGP